MVNRSKCLACMLLVNFLIFANCNGQNNQQMKAFENIGIPISKKSFDSSVTRCISLLKRENNINKDDFVTMIRLFNTIEILHSSDLTYVKFRDLFFPNYIPKASKAINATLSKGMCYYSKEFNIYIGGKPHQNSQFFITSNK